MSVPRTLIRSSVLSILVLCCLASAGLADHPAEGFLGEWRQADFLLTDISSSITISSSHDWDFMLIDEVVRIYPDGPAVVFSGIGYIVSGEFLVVVMQRFEDEVSMQLFQLVDHETLLIMSIVRGEGGDLDTPHTASLFKKPPGEIVIH